MTTLMVKAVGNNFKRLIQRNPSCNVACGNFDEYPTFQMGSSTLTAHNNIDFGVFESTVLLNS